MASDLPVVHLSSIDEERFGVRTAKASNVTDENLPAILDFCQINDVAFLIARCMVTELSAAQAMEQSGFKLMDTLLYYSKNLEKGPIPLDDGEATIRPVRQGEEDAVKIVTSESFRGYFGHYHADSKLDPGTCDEMYADWAYRSCVLREVADEVLVADFEGKIGGFATLQLSSPEEGTGILFGVAPFAQRRGLYRSLMLRGMEWCWSMEASRMVVSTQITNIGVQKVWARLGFEPRNAYYTFHKWFDKR